MIRKRIRGHIAVIFTIVIWGATFASTKILLSDFSPTEILFCRFLMGYLALCVVFPHRLHNVSKKHELYLALAGLCGISLYYLFENIALTYTSATNTGVIVSTSPFFTAILAYFFLKEKNLTKKFFLGFVLAVAGVFLISQSDSELSFNPFGDFLALLAAIVWAIYSIFIKKLSRFAFRTILVTKRVFFWGLLFILPLLFGADFSLNLAKFSSISAIGNLLFLGLGASALCFVTWNYALKILGTVTTSIYLYLVPVITVIFSVTILHEKITPLSALGIALTLLGTYLSKGRKD